VPHIPRTARMQITVETLITEADKVRVKAMQAG
jgi:hypothetical protein